jgi:tripartite-type tricarboxylate transporter receptor subunit TctC
MLTGINMKHIPYRGAAPALIDLLAERADIYFSPMSAAISYVRAGSLRALAVTTKALSEALPDCPSVAETVQGYESGQWYGLTAPKNTARDIVDSLNAAVNAVLVEQQFKQRLSDLGATILPQSPRQFAMMLSQENDKWARVVTFSGAKLG